MNKTLKTIGWICLALGVLGILADAGAIFAVRQFAADRTAAIQELRETAQDNSRPAVEKLCIAQDTDGDGKPDGDCLQQPERLRDLARGQGVQPGRRLMQIPRPALARRAAAGFGGLPIFFFALGPVLAVVGAVVLLVNRQPKEEKDMKEMADTKKEEKKPTKPKSSK